MVRRDTVLFRRRKAKFKEDYFKFFSVLLITIGMSPASLGLTEKELYKMRRKFQEQMGGKEA